MIRSRVAAFVAILFVLGASFSALTAHPTVARAAGNSTVYAWGYNGDGELGDGTGTNQKTPETVQLGLGVYAAAVDAGLYFTIAIGSNGKLYATGYNGYGELQSAPEYSYSWIPLSLPSGVTATAVAAGCYHNVVIGSDGNLYTFGYNGYGELGNGTTTNSSVPVKITLASGVTPSAISAGYYDSFAIGSNGNLYAWGENGNGELGDGTTTQQNSPEKITLAPGVTATSVAAGWTHTLAIGSDGNLYAWGANANGEVGNGTTADQHTPTLITLAPGVKPVAISAKNDYSLAIGSDGNVYAWGSNSDGQLGDGTTTSKDSPEKITLGSGVTATAVSAGGYHSMAIGSDGNVYTWGYNANGQIGDGTTTERNSPVAISLGTGITPTAISAGNVSSFALAPGPAQTINPTLFGWGYNYYYELGNGNYNNAATPEALQLASGVYATAVQSGLYFSTAVGSNGKLYAAGTNYYGSLESAPTYSPTWAPMALPSGVTAVASSAGSYHNMLIGSDGNLYTWGYNAYGEVGNGTTTNSSAPVKITLAAGVTAAAISAGAYGSFAIGSDGNLYGWGYNTDGELGDGTYTNQTSPEKITLAPGVKATAVAAGWYHTLAIGSDGNLYAWGQNSNGEVGDGVSGGDQNTPTLVTLAPGVKPVTISAGNDFSLAIGSDGNLYAWGANGDGQLGDGTTTERHTPEVISLASGVTPTLISAGGYHAIAAGSDGNVYTWGSNEYNQIGDGTTTERTSPVQISLEPGLVPTSISAGYYSTLVADSVPKQNQTITFGAISGHTYGDSDFNPGATASSGLTVAYTATGNCSVVSNKVHLTGAGSCTVTASQAGNSGYNAAPNVQQSFNIAKATLSVTAPSVSIRLDGSVPGFSPQYGSFVGSDSASNLATPPSCSSTAGATGTTVSSAPPYTYPVTCSGGTDPNYTFSYTGGTLTINADSLSYAGDTTFTDGSNGTLAATLTDAATGQPIADKSIQLTLAPNLAESQSCTAVTNASGTASCELTPVQGISDGFRGVLASFAGDSQYPAVSQTLTVTVNPQPTDTITYTGDTTMTNGAGAALSATLEDANGNPIVGRTLQFTLAPTQNAQTCSAVTDSTGKASCQIGEVNEPVGGRSVYVFFNGDTYAENSLNTPVTVVSAAQDTITYTGTSVADYQPGVLSATLTDSSTGQPIVGQTLSFELAPAGANQGCTGVTDATGTASCTIPYVTAATGTRTVLVNFAGGAGYPANQLSASINVETSLADTISYTGDMSFTNGTAGYMSMQLTDSATGDPISGQTVTIALAPAANNQDCTGVTDAGGDFSCTIFSVDEPTGTRTVRVTYGGGSGYPANQLDTQVSVN